ncbi:MAG TPA: B12-binding domain-containing radical SAM protein, partial [Thermoprotei archaeon]|nr:B12-binding domain-containing radical SAM protein [Thermoprotei archaeon]
MTLLALFKYNKVNANSLAYLLGALETSIVADKIDIELAENILEVLEDRLSQYDKVVVLYSLMTTQLPYYLKEFNILKSLKKKFRDRLLLVAGGPHPTGAPKNTLMKLGFDIAVVGEGEETLKDLLLALSEEYDLSTVSGLAIKTG